METLNKPTRSAIDFEHIFEISPDLILILDRDYTIIRANKAFSKRLNISSGSLVGSKCFWCIYQKDEPPDYCPHTQLLKDGMEHTTELFLESLTGWFSITATPLLNDKGEISGSIYIAHDITGQKRLEVALRESEEKYSRAFQTSFYAIAISSIEDGTYSDVNDAFSKVTGFTREEVINNSSTDLNLLVNPEDRDQVISLLMEGAEVKGREVQFRRKNGEVISTLFSAQVIYLNNKPFLLSSVLDVTEHKRAEEEIRQKNKELAKLLAEKDKFFGIIAHDLHSPFLPLLGFAQLLEDELLGMTQDQVKDIAHMMRISATRLFSLLENLLEWSRMQRGMIPFDPVPVLLFPKISLNLELVREPAAGKNIDVFNNTPEDLMVFADENMLSGIIRNLSSNAVKFTPKGGKVTFTAKQLPDGWVEVSVMDSGIGINQEMIENLFRLDVNTNRNGTDKESSTGLGLMICKEFVEKHGGKLWVHSADGQGSTFYFTLPGKKN